MLVLVSCVRGEEVADTLTGGHIKIATNVVTHY
jgi:hypothetical protein